MNNKGQSTIEFTFVLVVIVLMTWGLIQIFRWSGMDLAERRWAHDQTILKGQTPEEQLNADFYRAKRLNSVYRKAE
jgi:hypothetical protein